MTDYVVKLVVKGDGTAAVEAIEKVVAAEKAMAQTGTAAGATTTKALDEGAKASKRMADGATSAKVAISELERMTRVNAGTSAAASQRQLELASNLRNSVTQVLRLAGAFATFEGLKAFITGVVDASNALSGFQFGLKASLGSQEAAQSAMAFVRAEAERLGLDLRVSAQAFTSLAAAARGTSLEGEGARKIFSAVSEAARVLHLSTDATAGALNAIQQMMSKGNVQAEELRGQLGERLPGAFNLAAQAMGVTTSQLNKMLDDGKVLAADLLPKLADQLHKVYGAQAAEAANSPAAAFARLKNAVFEFQAAVGKAGVLDALAAGANTLTATLQTFMPLLPTLTAAFATLAAVIGANYVAGLLKAAVSTAAANSAMAEMAAMNLRAAQTAEAEAIAELAKARALELGGVAAGRVAAAESALAVAQLRTAEAAAASTAASLASTGALARLGSGALALVGGPIGAAVIAFAALAAAIYSSAKAEQERIATFNAGIVSMQQATKATRELIAERLKLSATPASLAEVVKQEASNTELLKQKSKELIEAKVSLNALEENAKTLALSGYRNVGIAELQKAQGEVSKLTAEMGRLQGATDDLTAEMRARLFKFLADDLPNAARDAGTALRGVFASLGKGDAAGSLTGVMNGLGTVVDGVKNRFLEADKAGTEAFKELKAGAASAKAEFDKFGLSQEQLARKQVEARLEAIKHGEYTKEKIALAKADGEAWIKNAAALDQAREARQHHTSAEKEGAKADIELANAQKSALDMLDSLSGELGAGAKVQADFDVGLRELQQRMEAWAIAGGDVTRILAEWQRGEALLRAELDKKRAALAKQGDVLGNYLAQLEKDKLLSRMTERERALSVAVAEQTAIWQKNAAAGITNAQSLEEVEAGTRAAAGAAFDLAKNASVVADFVSEFGDLDPFERMRQGIEEVGKALDEAIGEGASEKVNKLQRSLGRMRQSMVDGIVRSSQDGLRSIQSMTTEGSRAFQAMQIAIDALTVVQAISAVLNQGQGDPYTAFARMAAMAAAVAALGVSIRNFGNAGLSDTSAQHQATQGTGSVLGDADAKSESIANATEITANATQQLVGLNRGMLNALQGLQSALGSAGGFLAREAAQADFSGLNLAAKPFDFKDPLTNFLLGGSSKVTDQGIVIFGGALNQLLDHIAVGAYQEVKSKSWVFGSTKTKTGIKDVSDEFEKQFGLVMQSIANTVKQGALALGLLPEQVEAAMAAFKVEEIKISLKGLSAEEQQKEIEAVFSKIFDGLAGAVVPFIGQFQQVGEGLGETLIRIATEVQVTQEAFKQLGLAVDEADPEKFAQISDALVQASGGIDDFISGMQSFVANFAPEAHQFQVASDAINSAFAQVGLSVPATRDGMWELMQSLDATTEAGREQIATLLRLADVSDQYYDMLDKQAEAAASYAEMMADINNELKKAAHGYVDNGAFGKSMADIDAWREDSIAKANQLARAAGMAAARENDLANIELRAAQLRAQAIQQLKTDTQDLVAQLYGGPAGSLDGINAQIAALESAQQSAAQATTDLADASRQRYEDEIAAIERIRGYVKGLLLNQQLTTLTPKQQLEEAQRQYEALLARAKAGDASALAQLPDAAQAFLERGRSFYASNDQYQAIFDSVTQALNALGARTPAVPSGGGSSGPVTFTASAELQALYERRDALLAEQERQTRLAMAQQLAVQLEQLAAQTGEPVLELARNLGVKLDKFISDLGINLSDLTVETTGQLADLAGALGISLSSLADSVGFSLGDLADQNSLINDLLEKRIQGLPGGERAMLEPLFRAIESATNEADANAAIDALRGKANDLPTGIRDLLAPILGLPKSTADAIVGTQRATDNAAKSTADVARYTDRIDTNTKYGLYLNGGSFGLANIADVHTGAFVQLHNRLAEIRDAVGGHNTYGTNASQTSQAFAEAPNLALLAIAKPDNSQDALIAALREELAAVRAEVSALRAERKTGDAALIDAIDGTADATLKAAETAAREQRRLAEKMGVR